MRTLTRAAFWSRHGHGGRIGRRARSGPGAIRADAVDHLNGLVRQRGEAGARSAPSRSAIAPTYSAPDLAQAHAHDTDLPGTTVTSPALAAIVRS
ncbi:MAG: hypothetical protein PWP40_2698 [Rhodocyclaceae bacterium]|nr:hypothetical protein [Rhodocyclaceae bacterium]